MSSTLRIGWGMDVHRLGGEPPLLLGGVVVDDTRGVEATSDGDVAAHAVTDAVLGAASLGDLGEHFPSDDPRWHGADSLELLREAVRMAADAGVRPRFADVTVIAQQVRVAPHRGAIAAGLAGALGLAASEVSVKATTTDGLGWIGRGEGIGVVAVVTATVAS